MFSSILEGAGHDAGLPRHGGEVWREENPRPDVQEMAALSKTCRLRTIVKTVPVENISLKFSGSCLCIKIVEELARFSVFQLIGATEG